MAITVNTDTYISLSDCEAYLAANYISTDAKYVAWIALSESNKEILLRKAAKLIDRQPLQGFKAISTQTMMFPRIIYTDITSNVLNPNAVLQGSNWYIQSAVPDAVKHAQCEIALQLAQGTSERAELQRQGVMSFSIGNLSESFKGGSYSIPSFEAKELLAPFIGGGFRI